MGALGKEKGDLDADFTPLRDVGGTDPESLEGFTKRVGDLVVRQ